MEDVLKSLDYTKETKLLEKDVIQKKGVDIEDSTTFRSYVDKIMEIDCGADSFIYQNDYYNMIKEVYFNYKRDALDLMYSLEGKINKGSLLSFVLVYDYKGSDLSYYVPTSTNDYNDYIMYLDIDGNNIKESNVLEKYEYKNHDYAVIIAHTVEGFLEDNKIDYIIQLSNKVDSSNLEHPYLLLNTNYDITNSNFLDNFKYDFTDNSDLNFDNYTSNEISIYLNHHDFGPKFIKRILQKVSSFGGTIEIRLGVNHNLLGEFDLGDQVFENGTRLFFSQNNDNYTIFKGNLSFKGFREDGNPCLVFYDSSSSNSNYLQTSCFVGNIDYQTRINLKTISFIKGDITFNDLDIVDKNIQQSDNNFVVFENMPRYIDGNVNISCGYRNDVISNDKYGDITYLPYLSNTLGINGNIRIILNNCSFGFDLESVNYLKGNVFIYGNNKYNKHQINLFTRGLNLCRQLIVDNISLNNYKSGKLFSINKEVPKITLNINRFIDILSPQIDMNLTNFDCINGFFRTIVCNNYCFYGLTNQRFFRCWRQVALWESVDEFSLFNESDGSNINYKHFGGINEISITSNYTELKSINKLNLYVDGISRIRFGGMLSDGTYLPININTLNLVNINRLSRLDSIDFKTSNKFNENVGLDINLNNKYSIYPLNLSGYVLNNNTINITTCDYDDRIIPLYLLITKSNNGNIVIKNKIPNNCIDYIYENAEIYDSANDEYIGDHKFSCGLVDESDEDKYKELFSKKGWIFEKYTK